jgi:hypothetical protein
MTDTIITQDQADRLHEKRTQIDRLTDHVSEREEARRPLDDMARLMESADSLMIPLMHGVDDDAMQPPQRLLWNVGMEMLEESDDSMMRAGYVQMINAVLATPGAADACLQVIRDELVEADPSIALVAAPVAPKADRVLTDEQVVNALPMVLNSIREVNGVLQSSFEHRETFDRAQNLDLLINVFIRDELERVEPDSMRALHYADYGNPGWATLGTLCLFKALMQHPDLCELLIKRVHDALGEVWEQAVAKAMPD